MSIHLSPDESALVSTHHDGIAYLIRVNDPKHTFPLAPGEVDYPCWDAAFTHDNRHLATAEGNGRVII